MEKRFRIKNMEPFKDGNVLGGRFLKPGEVLIVTEREATLIENSGGIIERIEMVIPNPLKREEPADEKPEAKPNELSSYKEEEPAVGKAKPGQTVSKPRKSGRKS